MPVDLQCRLRAERLGVRELRRGQLLQLERVQHVPHVHVERRGLLDRQRLHVRDGHLRLRGRLRVHAVPRRLLLPWYTAVPSTAIPCCPLTAGYGNRRQREHDDAVPRVLHEPDRERAAGAVPVLARLSGTLQYPRKPEGSNCANPRRYANPME